MATLQNGINGGFSGKVGNVVGYQLNGKWIIRSLPKTSRKNKKGTSAQKACRTGFRKMQYFLSPIVNFIRIGFNMESKKRMMTAHNVAKSYNMLNAQLPDGTIVYEKVCVSYGNLLEVENPEIAVAEDGVVFIWTNNSGNDHERKLDQVMLLAYDDEHKLAFSELGGAKRVIGTEKLIIPKLKTKHQYHAWITFISNNREDISMSSYCGSFEY